MMTPFLLLQGTQCRDKITASLISIKTTSRFLLHGIGSAGLQRLFVTPGEALTFPRGEASS
jgi:hypothetical protein